MTQDVQPLTWQKRTNLEEHQQFFSKINEIIDNLAPTVDEAEAAIAQATAAIASANDAIATANAASAAASAAASQAQTAASTVAGYDSRLTAAEGDIDAAEGDITALQGRMGTAEGNITALQNVQADYVKKAGAAQTVTSQIMVPTTATGTRDTQIANGTRIQNDLDAYEAMIRTTGAQTKSGVMTFLNEIVGFLRYRWYWSSGTNAGKWVKIASMPSNMLHFYLEMDSRYDHTVVIGSSADMFTKTNAVTAGMNSKFKMIVESDGTFTLWFRLTDNYNAYYARFINAERYGSELTVTILTDTNVYDEPTPGTSSYESSEMVQ